YKEPIFIISILSLIAAGLIYYYFDDIHDYFKPGNDDPGNNHSNSDWSDYPHKGKFINSKRATLDRIKLEKMRAANAAHMDDALSRTSSADTITLNPRPSDVANENPFSRPTT